MKAEELSNLYIHMFLMIGGESNSDVYWYMNERPKIVTRKSFFRASIWAIWVSGLSRKDADAFLSRAEDEGFDWNFIKFCTLWEDAKRRSSFMN